MFAWCFFPTLGTIPERRTLDMLSESPDSSDQDKEPFVEVDPSGRFGRYSDLLGAGAVKKVYRAFDQWEGTDVAWNQV